jgi:hypothetical protein
MPAPLLQLGCSMTCPHGGQVQAVASQSKVQLGGQPALLASDTTTVAGCAFNVSGAPSPCMTVEWSAPATKVTIGGQAPLLATSVGLCKSAAGAPQGSVLIASTQQKVTAS